MIKNILKCVELLQYSGIITKAAASHFKHRCLPLFCDLNYSYFNVQETRRVKRSLRSGSVDSHCFSSASVAISRFTDLKWRLKMHMSAQPEKTTEKGATHTHEPFTINVLNLTELKYQCGCKNTSEFGFTTNCTPLNYFSKLDIYILNNMVIGIPYYLYVSSKIPLLCS